MLTRWQELGFFALGHPEVRFHSQHCGLSHHFSAYFSLFKGLIFNVVTTGFVCPNGIKKILLNINSFKYCILIIRMSVHTLWERSVLHKQQCTVSTVSVQHVITLLQQSEGHFGCHPFSLQNWFLLPVLICSSLSSPSVKMKVWNKQGNAVRVVQVHNYTS